MSLVDATGKQISEGPTGRAIVIKEHVQNGRSTWGIDFVGFVEGIDVFEIIQTLSEVNKAVCVKQRLAIAEDKIKADVQKKLDDLAKGDPK